MQTRIAPAVLKVAILALSVALSACSSLYDLRGQAPTGLSDNERVVIQQACTDLSTAYAHYLDTADYEHMPSIFAPDGVWEVLGNHLQGPDAIREYWRGRTSLWKPNEAWLHIIGNQRIDVVDRDHAKGSAYFSVYKVNTEPGANKLLAPLVFSKTTDEYVRTQEGWRIKLRRIERVADAGPPN